MTFVAGTDPKDTYKYSGEFFNVTPRVELRDAGGNLVWQDSSSGLSISIYGNSYGAKLGLEESLFPTAVNGIVTCNALVIDKPGNNYTLLFSLFRFSVLFKNYTDTGVFLLSDKFTVGLGHPRMLSVVVEGGGAWAGNQAMAVQPTVHVTDLGGNVLSNDFDTVVTGHIVGSLALDKVVIVDTNNDTITTVKKVTMNVDDGTYGAGTIIEIYVTFTSEVWVNVTDANYLPYISTYVFDSNNHGKEARLVGEYERTTMLTFRYIVEQGDNIQVGTPPYFDVPDLTPIHGNGSEIVNGNHIPVDTTFPMFLVTNYSVLLDTGNANSISTDTSKATGTYGEGEEIDFLITFDRAVTVSGYPYFNVTAETFVEYANVSFYKKGVANFSYLSEDNLTAHFVYTVGKGDATNALNVDSFILYPTVTVNVTQVFYWNGTYNASIPVGNGTFNSTSNMMEYNYTYVPTSYDFYNYSVESVDVALAYIKTYSDYPSTDSNTGLLQGFVSGASIVIDTTQPVLDTGYGIQTSKEDGTYYPGEHIFLTVRFDKAVTTFGEGIYLRLACGSHSTTKSLDYQGRAYKYGAMHADNVTMEFLYIVETNTNCTKLDIVDGSALVTDERSWIRQLTTHPSCAANLSTADIFNGGTSLKDQAALKLQGYPPTVDSVSVVSTVPSGATTLYPDDTVTIEVVFSAPVVANCSPVMVMYNNYAREATYVSGNGSDTFTFEYIVKMGDKTDTSISYRNTPYALCPVAGCPYTTDCKILANSTHPSLPVTLKLSKPSTTWNSGVSFGSQTISAESLTRGTTVTSIDTVQEAGEYGAGSEIRFQVHFSDIVVVHREAGSVYPRLKLNNNKHATYIGGNMGDTLYFSYFTTSSDTMLMSDFAPLTINDTDSAIDCNYHRHKCNITNQAGVGAALNTSSLVIGTGISLDPTPPVVESVSTDKGASFYDGIYSEGELIQILVKVDKPVIVTGFAPRILMDVGVAERYAVYNESWSNSTHLVFDYVVGAGDVAADLTYTSDCTIDLYGGQSVIYRRSSVPTTAMDVSLPCPPSGLSNSGSVINVNTSVVPQVVQVVSISKGGLYAGGDVVTFRVDFDHYVIAKGNSFLTLDVGGKIGLAWYVGYSDVLTLWTEKEENGASNATKHLFYQYTVRQDDVSFDLQYADSFSYFAGLTDNHDRGTISSAASFTEQPANLDLPSPGGSGSLSDDGVRIQIDGRAPYITHFGFLSDSGTYGVGDTIDIVLTFSAAVAVYGTPSILLETGEYDNEAFFSSGNNTKQLVFTYSPLLGDHNKLLDYHSERLLYNSAIHSFHFNGGRILAASVAPTVPAEIWLNPPSGELLGTTSVVDDAGVCAFKDVWVSRRGPGYQMRFSSDIVEVNRTITTYQSVNVSFSAEYQLRPREALKGKLIGKSVDIQGDFAILGSPNSNRSVTTLQTVTSAGADANSTVREVQMIQTMITPQPSIQQFHTTADIGASISGYFTISYGVHGPSGPIPFNADPTVMVAIITYDLHLGDVTVTKSPYLYCACENAYTWTVTFNDKNNEPFDLITIDSTLLSGDGVMMMGPTMIQSSAVIGGTFKLIGLGKTTSNIPYDANVAQMTAAVEQLGLPVYSIEISPTASDLTRSWSVTFDAYNEWYDVPQVTGNASGLTGGETSIWTETLRPGVNGPNGIGGYFQLEWRGNTTQRLLANATADEVKYALEALPVINFVNVNRSFLSDNNGYTWTIEFVSVNRNTPRGYMYEDVSNVEPIIPINHLIATDVTLIVGSKYYLGDRNELSMIPRQGTYGQGAGAVYIYQRQNESWNQVATIVGNDTSTYNQFGGSVSIDQDVILVGAVGANMNGVPEIQTLHCEADSGYFQLSFRGWTTDYIGHNVSRLELIDLIVSSAETFSNLYTVFSVTIDSWGEGGFCEGANGHDAVITFFSPVDGDTLGNDMGPNLELLTLNKHNLTLLNDSTLAVLEIEEVQNGTWVVHGKNADQQQIGAAYIFRAQYSCNMSSTHCVKSNWTQEAQLFPTAFANTSRFGYAVSISGNIAVVGAPGTKQEQGYVYLFEYNGATGVWEHLQIIKDPTITNGDNFGSSVSIHGWTLVVGAPNYASGTGAAYVFKRNTEGATFVSSQTVLPPINSFTLVPGDLFGFSVSVNNNLLVVGSPGRPDKSIYLGTTAPDTKREQSGVVFAFERTSSKLNFAFLQQLTPSNVKARDRFGYSVRVEGLNIVASSMDDYIGEYQSDKAVVEVLSQADYNTTPLSGTFVLHWLTTSLTNNASTYSTRPIPHDATALDMKKILQADLPIGEILVSRSNVDVYNGGYSWLITFTGLDSEINLFTSDVSKLKGTNASVVMSFVNTNPQQRRSLTHLFQRDAIATKFTEQAFLSPFKHQANDRCGESVAIHGKYALVGCSNRDQFVPGQNSGAGFIYHLGILGLQYSSAPTEVTEGDVAEFTVTHNAVQMETIAEDVLFYFQSYDRNAFTPFQTFIKHLYGVAGSELIFPQTFVDYISLAGQAVARSQFYGSVQQWSRWVDGMYDYLGISDYVPQYVPNIFLWEADSINEEIVTTPDTITEAPEETVSYAIFSPGLWPSPLGRLFDYFTITDTADGVIEDEPVFSKLQDELVSESDTDFGSAVSICEEIGVAISGAPMATVDDRENAGKVFLFRKVNNVWVQQTTVLSSPLPDLNGTYYGAAVIVTRILGLNISLLAVGEPGANRVHVYSSTGANVGTSYSLDKTLSEDEAFYPQHRYGESLGLNGHMLVVGAPGIDTVYLYRYVYSNETSLWKWSNGELLRCADYDYDVLDTTIWIHRQNFGKSIAVSQRSIVIGAPFADYDKLGSNLPETNWFTEGTDIFGYGRGKVYVYYSTPAVQTVRISAVQELKNGQFQLNYVHYGMNETTSLFHFKSPALEVEAALNALLNIESVTVDYHSTDLGSSGYEYVWTVTFNNDWQEPAVLKPIWHNYGCYNCTPFSSLSEVPSEQIVVTVAANMSEVKIQQELSASDKRNGNRFGWSVAVDGSQIAVGAPYSSSTTTTSWDFESGTLLGWHKTGDAFDFQPTFGDNSYLHATVASQSVFPRKPLKQSSGVQGLYYISTAEKRPGNPLDYSVPDPFFPPGSNQGDEPTGTLSSDVFIIPVNATTINFMIGGGCDIYKVYVELVVDGLSVAKRTGKCSEKMSAASFDVTNVIGRAALIRIVDRSTANWGHISVDSFTFDWDIYGASIPNENQRVTAGGVVEAERSGAMYVYHRINVRNTSLICTRNEFHCLWVQESEMVASDKRPDMQFGTAVAINDTAGIAVASAPNAQFTGFYKEDPAVYPYQNESNDASVVAGLSYPVNSQFMPYFQSFGAYVPDRSGGFGVWYVRQLQDVAPDKKAYEHSGAVYVYIRRKASITYDGVIVKQQYWYPLEHAKLQAPDTFARDYFGASVSLSGSALSVGSPGQNGMALDAGAAYVYQLGFACLSFSSVSYQTNSYCAIC